MDSVNIGQEIIILRGTKGWTQQQLADMLQTTVRTIGAWESGAFIPRNAMKVKIAKVFELPEDYFLSDDGKAVAPETFQQRETEVEDVMRKLEKLLSESDAVVSETQKKFCLDSCYKILTDIPKK